MRSKFVLGSMFACAILIACSSSNNSTVLDDTDAGDDDTDKPSTSTKKDSGTSSTKDAGKDSGRGNGDAAKDDDGGTGAAKVGDSCTDSTTCSGTVAAFCSSDNQDGSTLDPSPYCMGECDGSTLECDGAGTICHPQYGLCMQGCAASTTAITKPCAGKNACEPLGLDDSGTLLGACGGGCKTSADCTNGDKCQEETGFCVKTLTTATVAVGGSCTANEDCAYGCLLPTTVAGYCTRVCTVGTAGQCPQNFTCSIGFAAADFDGNPTGLQGNCLKNCTAATDCAAGADADSWECAALGAGVHACLPK